MLKSPTMEPGPHVAVVAVLSTESTSRGMLDAALVRPITAFSLDRDRSMIDIYMRIPRADTRLRTFMWMLHTNIASQPLACSLGKGCRDVQGVPV
jgi:hypothetical protein